jgi:RNA 3'-terminal phosphate cyclase (ATP)
VLELDGSYGEGGGQLVRTAVALSAITGRALAIRNIRANRDKPGLAPQHVAAVQAVAALAGARVEGAELRSRSIQFSPHALAGGSFRFDVGTAGSVTLLLQALLPVMIASGKPCDAEIVGGTDVRMAPPLDYFREVLLHLLSRMGARVRLEVGKRGYYPRGGGEVRVSASPSALRPTALCAPGALRGISGLAHVANLPEHIATRMRASALEQLTPMKDVTPDIACRVLGTDDATGPGGAIVVWAHTEGTVLGAGRTAERGVRAEALGEAAGKELAADLAAGGTADVHAADQLLVYFALAGGGELRTRTVSSHARTGIWLIEQFLPVRFEVSQAGALARIALAAR